jgi:hypothetical protein
MVSLMFTTVSPSRKLMLLHPHLTILLGHREVAEGPTASAALTQR